MCCKLPGMQSHNTSKTCVKSVLSHHVLGQPEAVRMTSGLVLLNHCLAPGCLFLFVFPLALIMMIGPIPTSSASPTDYGHAGAGITSVAFVSLSITCTSVVCLLNMYKRRWPYSQLDSNYNGCEKLTTPSSSTRPVEEMVDLPCFALFSNGLPD